MGTSTVRSSPLGEIGYSSPVRMPARGRKESTGDWPSSCQPKVEMSPSVAGTSTAGNCTRRRDYRPRPSRDFVAAVARTRAGNGLRRTRTALFRLKANTWNLAATGPEAGAWSAVSALRAPRTGQTPGICDGKVITLLL